MEPDLRKLAVPIEKLKHDPKQAKSHDRRSIDAIKRSLEKHGQKKPIVVKKKGMQVKAGNGTLEAAKELGWTHIAAVVSNDPDKALRDFAISDNRSAELATWDRDVLAAEFDVLGTGFEDYGWSEEEYDVLGAIDMTPPDHEYEPTTGPYQSAGMVNPVKDKALQPDNLPGSDVAGDTSQLQNRRIIVVFGDDAQQGWLEERLGVKISDNRYIYNVADMMPKQ